MARQKLIHIHSFVNGKAPSLSTVSFGEIAVNCNSNSPKLYIKTATSSTETTAKIESFSPDSVIDKKFVIVKGEADNSAVLKGEYEGYSNKAISQTSMAVGAATTAGLKGWYYSAIDFTNKKITLSDRPTYILAGSTLLNGGWSSGVPNIKVNDVISLVNDSKYDFCSKVTAISGNVITVDSLPFTELVRDNGAAVAVIAEQFSDGYSVYIPDRPDAGIIDFGGGAFSEGGQSKASNICAHAEGLQTHAYGQYSHTEGWETKAGYIAHAEGSKSEAIGNASHAEGTENIAVNSNTHVEGRYTKATGYAAHAEGYGESLENPNLAQGNYSHVEGEKTKSLGIASHAEGGSSIAKGNFSHSEGRFTRAHALCSHAEGFSVEGSEDAYGAFGPISHVEGYANTTTSTANSAHAEGRLNVAKGIGAHVEGISNVASGEAAHAEGCYTEASGKGSHAEGGYSGAGVAVVKASGDYSHAEGSFTIASGYCSHAEGNSTSAIGNNSHAEGFGTEAQNNAEHASGYYNISTKSSDAAKRTQFSIGIGTSDTDRKNAFEVKQNGDIYIEGVGGYDGTNPDSSDDLATVLSNRGGANGGGMTNVTHSELVGLRNSSTLKPGMFYRITDYVTTTTQSNTQSAGHQFDIIVVADDVNVLNENARAIQHEEDTYFSNSDLNAWQLKYCLDNDTNRFAWVDTENGKGVIYYMKDEFNNECPYDFKNIIFIQISTFECILYGVTHTYSQNGKVISLSGVNYYGYERTRTGNGPPPPPTPLYSDESVPSMSMKLYQISEDVVTEYSSATIKSINIKEGESYTFQINGNDASLNSSDYCYGNSIGRYLNNGVQQLNNIIFSTTDYPYLYCYANSFDENCYNNSFGNTCHDNSFGNTCYNNSFGNTCYNNSFGNTCYNNSFGKNCHDNSFGTDCHDNSFGNTCYINSFGNRCYNNSFGENCYINSFGENCNANSFGNDCDNNSFGNTCHNNSFGYTCNDNSFAENCFSNSFGNTCSANSFGKNCHDNSFGTDCHDNSFGNTCYINSFGNRCYNNSFGNTCSANSFGESKTNLKSYYRYIIFDNGNSYINLNCTSTTSSSKYYQNVRIGLGVNNTTTYKTINDSNVGQTYETLYKPANSQTITI